MSTINDIPDTTFYDPDSWIGLAPDYDWDKLAPIKVTAIPPVFDDVADTFTIPAVEGVQYLAGTDPLEPGEVLIGDVDYTLTINARALDGYVLEGVTTWTLTFTTAA